MTTPDIQVLLFDDDDELGVDGWVVVWGELELEEPPLEEVVTRFDDVDAEEVAPMMYLAYRYLT